MTNNNTASVAPLSNVSPLLAVLARRAGMTVEAYMAAKAARIEAQQAETARTIAAEKAARLASRVVTETELWLATEGRGWFEVTQNQITDAWLAGHDPLKAVYERRTDGRVVRSHYSAKR